MVKIATKTLSRVEVDANASNQHELHAGILRRLLGFEESRVEGTLTFVYYTQAGASPEVDEDRFTLVDVRRTTPGRSEYHLYYYSQRFQVAAQPGDLLVMLRPTLDSPDLFGIVARFGTQVERDLRAALALGPNAVISRFLRPKPTRPTEGAAGQLAIEMAAPAAHRLRDHPLYVESIQSRSLPPSTAMAAAAHELVQQQHGAALDADSFLLFALDAESDLFFALEQAIGDAELREILNQGGGFEEVLAFSMSKIQSRRARRGLSLQNHMEALFEHHGVPYSAQCRTEGGAVPDFVIPSCAKYHDQSYPETLLRMVGCKSRIRERWPQYLREAERIHPKFHVSVDEDLTGDLIERMHAAGLRLFMPRQIRDRNYDGTAASAAIGTIAGLLDDLSRIVP